MRRPRAIIFDDEAVLLELLGFCFAKWGYEVFAYRTPIVCPSSGRSFGSCAGSSECRVQCADLVISDFKMPQMTGIELFQLQAQRGCRIDNKMKAIMSGCTDAKLLKQCEDSGYRFFEKPFECSDLTDWLSECEKHFDLSKQLGGKKTDKRSDFKQDIEYYKGIALQNT